MNAIKNKPLDCINVDLTILHTRTYTHTHTHMFTHLTKREALPRILISTSGELVCCAFLFFIAFLSF